MSLLKSPLVLVHWASKFGTMSRLSLSLRLYCTLRCTILKVALVGRSSLCPKGMSRHGQIWLGPQKEKTILYKDRECALNIHRNSLGSENALLLKGTSREVDAVLPS